MGPHVRLETDRQVHLPTQAHRISSVRCKVLRQSDEPEELDRPIENCIELGLGWRRPGMTLPPPITRFPQDERAWRSYANLHKMLM